MKGNMGCSRRGAAAAALNGQIWVVGGWDGQAYLKAVEVYDMATARWSQVKSLESRVTDYCRLEYQDTSRLET